MILCILFVQIFIAIVPLEKYERKKFEKNNITIALNLLFAKKEKHILLMFQKINQIVKNKLFF